MVPGPGKYFIFYTFRLLRLLLKEKTTTFPVSRVRVDCVLSLFVSAGPISALISTFLGEKSLYFSPRLLKCQILRAGPFVASHWAVPLFWIVRCEPSEDFEKAYKWLQIRYVIRVLEGTYCARRMLSNFQSARPYYMPWLVDNISNNRHFLFFTVIPDVTKSVITHQKFFLCCYTDWKIRQCTQGTPGFIFI